MTTTILETKVPGTEATVKIEIEPAYGPLSDGTIRQQYTVTRMTGPGFNYLSCSRSTEAEAREMFDFLLADAIERIDNYGINPETGLAWPVTYLTAADRAEGAEMNLGVGIANYLVTEGYCYRCAEFHATGISCQSEPMPRTRDLFLRTLAARAAIHLGGVMKSEGFSPTDNDVRRIANSFRSQLVLEVEHNRKA